MEQKNIELINELQNKSTAEVLTPDEEKDQKILRKEYMELIRVNLRSQLNNIDLEQNDGSRVNLGEKYGEKYMNKKGNQDHVTEFTTGSCHPSERHKYKAQRFLSITGSVM